jgi:hypothetical protein
MIAVSLDNAHRVASNNISGFIFMFVLDCIKQRSNHIFKVSLAKTALGHHNNTLK